MQIVQVFRFVYYNIIYIFCKLKDASFMGKVRFRRATLSFNSSYSLLFFIQSFSYLQVTMICMGARRSLKSGTKVQFDHRLLS